MVPASDFCIPRPARAAGLPADVYQRQEVGQPLEQIAGGPGRHGNIQKETARVFKKAIVEMLYAVPFIAQAFFVQFLDRCV